MSTLKTTNLQHASAASPAIVLAADGSATVPTLSSTSITGTTIQGTIKSGIAVASTSGTSIDFTAIPSWVKRVTVMFNNVSTNGSSNIIAQIGAGSFTTSGYTSFGEQGAGSGTGSVTSGLLVKGFVGAAFNSYGSVVINNVTGNTWVSSALLADTNNAQFRANGIIDLSGTLDRIRITTVNGTDTFDAGSINILYEG